MKPVLFISLLFLSVGVIGQHSLTPSVDAVEKKWIRNSNSQMSWYMIMDTATIELGEVITQTIKRNDSLIIITHVNVKSANSTWIDSTIADLNTLRPITHSSYNAQRDMVLNFGPVVTGYYYDKKSGQRTVIADSTTAAYFDSNIYTALLAWLPLKDGYTQTISIYDVKPGAKKGVLKAWVRNVNSGVYQSKKSGLRNAWIVTAADEIGGEDGTVTYYFDKTDRKLWKQVITTRGRQLLMQAKE